MKHTLVLGLLSAALLLAGGPARPQGPAASMRLIVPTPAGGPSDSAARVLAQALARSSGAGVVVENKPGAGGAIAAQAVMAAPPDGRTLLWGIASMAGLPMLQKSPPFQSLAELTPVSLVGRFAFGMFVHPDVPARTVGEFVAYATANGGTLSCAHGTLGEFMAAAQFMQATGVRTLLVPYKGGAQLMPDLIAGRVRVNFGPMSSGLQHVNAGKLRLLATLAPSRSTVAPDVPTLAEAGVATDSLPTWQAVFAPPGTAREIAARISKDIAQALADPAVRTQFERQALQPEGSTPQALASVVAGDIEVWRAFVRDNQVAQE